MVSVSVISDWGFLALWTLGSVTSSSPQWERIAGKKKWLPGRQEAKERQKVPGVLPFPLGACILSNLTFVYQALLLKDPQSRLVRLYL